MYLKIYQSIFTRWTKWIGGDTIFIGLCVCVSVWATCQSDSSGVKY